MGSFLYETSTLLGFYGPTKRVMQIHHRLLQEIPIFGRNREEQVASPRSKKTKKKGIYRLPVSFS
jgi:hypothetical protein